MGSRHQLAQSGYCPAEQTTIQILLAHQPPSPSLAASPSSTMSNVKQNFHLDSEAFINKQINMELYASYVYLSMYAYFSRDDVALHGFAKRFQSASTEERQHAEKLIDYQIKRGGRVTFQPIAKPTIEDWGSALEAIKSSLELEKTVNESLLTMHKVAADHGDSQMTDFIEGDFLEEQVESIKEIADLLTRMNRAGEGLGLLIIDKELMS